MERIALLEKDNKAMWKRIYEQTKLIHEMRESAILVRQAVEDALSIYLLGLRKQWAENERVIVRIAQCETVILQIPGVVDIRDTKINGIADNLSLQSHQIPILGAVTHETA